MKVQDNEEYDWLACQQALMPKGQKTDKSVVVTATKN